MDLAGISLRIADRTAIALLCLSSTVSLPALAADIPTASPALTALPGCTDTGVLGTIRDRFAYGAARVEKRTLTIEEISRIVETGVSIGNPRPTAQRWCSAAVTLSDKTTSTLTYRIDQGAGFAAPGYFGWPSGVEFCVAGHDPWHVHDGKCRTTRPSSW